MGSAERISKAHLWEPQICRTRDNTEKCFKKSAAAASRYCTAQLNSLTPGPVTLTVSVTQSPTNTVTVTTAVAAVTTTVCSIPELAVRRRSEAVHTVVERDGPMLAAVAAGPPGHGYSPKIMTTKTTMPIDQATPPPSATVKRSAAGLVARANAGRADAAAAAAATANAGAPIPACIMKSSLPQSVLVSACSCLGVTVPNTTSTITSTVYVTAADPTVTATLPSGTATVTQGVATLAAFELVAQETGAASPVVRVSFPSGVFTLEYNLPGSPAAVFMLGSDGTLRTDGDLVGALNVPDHSRLGGLSASAGDISPALMGCVSTGQPAELQCQFLGAPVSFHNDLGSNPQQGSGIALNSDGILVKLMVQNPQYSCPSS